MVCINYVILIICVSCADCREARRTYAHLGSLHACNLFEFVNLVIFWTIIPIMVSCFNCSHLPRGLRNMLIGAYSNYESFKAYKKAISKQEALNAMNQEVYQASISWDIRCFQSFGTTNEEDKTGKCSWFNLQYCHTFVNHWEFR